MSELIARHRFHVAIFCSAAAVTLLLLVWLQPMLSPDRPVSEPEPATLTTEEKQQILHALGQSTSSEAPRNDKRSVLQAISDDAPDQSLSTETKRDILNSLKRRNHLGPSLPGARPEIATMLC